MPFYQKGDTRIRYEDAGSGFPLVVTPGGGLNSTTLVFFLYQKGRDSRIFQAQDRAIDDFTLIGGARAQRGTADKTRLIIGCGDCTNSFMR